MLKSRAPAKSPDWRHRIALAVLGAHEGLVADDAAVGDAEYRLEMAAKPKAGVLTGCAPVFDADPALDCIEAGGGLG